MADETPGRDDAGREDSGRTVRDETPVYDQSTEDRNRAVAQKHSLLSRLYTGTGAFEIVGKRKMWYLVSAAIIAIRIPAAPPPGPARRPVSATPARLPAANRQQCWPPSASRCRR